MHQNLVLFIDAVINGLFLMRNENYDFFVKLSFIKLKNKDGEKLEN